MKKIELETRYNREAWLATAMEVLSREGQSKLRTERLANDLGVTRGSFYHHFKNRDDFVVSLVEHWAQTFTDQVNANVASQEAPADQRMLFLMRIIRDNRLDKYDIAFRSWAAQEPIVAEKVREVDQVRYAFMVQLFEEMGFSGDDLEERVRLFLVYESAQHTVWFPEQSRSVSDSIERRFEMITGRKAPSD